jgi:hypothetical protein
MNKEPYIKYAESLVVRSEFPSSSKWKDSNNVLAQEHAVKTLALVKELIAEDLKSGLVSKGRINIPYEDQSKFSNKYVIEGLNAMHFSVIKSNSCIVPQYFIPDDTTDPLIKEWYDTCTKTQLERISNMIKEADEYGVPKITLSGIYLTAASKMFLDEIYTIIIDSGFIRIYPKD